MKTSYWQRIPEIIGPAKAEEFDRLGQQDTRQALEEWILARATPETTLLDAGCNTGAEGYRLFQQGFPGSYFGVDSNPKALQFAVSNLSGQRAWFMRSELSALPLGDRAFEIVLSKDVLEHSFCHKAIIQELARIADRAVVISFFIKPAEEDTRFFRHRDGYFLNYYNRNQLFDTFHGAGLGDEEMIFENEQDQVFVFWKR